jgi:thiamine pyrophosphokinase
VANGALRWTEGLARLAEAARPLLAADGGGDHLARIGLRPDLLIGDLDSVSEATRAWIGEERVVLRPDQDRTDLEKALIHAFDELRLPRLTVLGALGGRPDHEVGNLGLLARRALGDRLVYRDEGSLILATARRMELEAVPGETWSFWTYDPAVRVTLEGVRWPLHEAPLDAGGHPSISNRAAASRVQVTPHGGPVLIMRWLTPP